MNAYRFLIPKEKIEPGDELRKEDGSWMIITKEHIETWKIFYKEDMICRHGESQIRRFLKRRSSL